MTGTLLTSQSGSVDDQASAHVILVGLPGSGKSTVGAAVGERLGRSFMDLDREVERREGASVSQIFAEHGEEYFRRRERELTTEVRAMPPLILSPGGGWITNPDVVALLRPPSRIIYLKVTPATALKRLGDERTTRPLLSGPDPLAELTRLFEQRSELYEAADHVIDTEPLEIEGVIRKVLELASFSGGGYVSP